MSLRPTLRAAVALQAPACAEVITWQPGHQPPTDERGLLDLRFTAAGRALPPGHYQLRAVAA